MLASYVWQLSRVSLESGAPATEMEGVMTRTIRRWRSDRRYRSTLRALRSLSARQLSELGIRPFEIQRLAREAARVL